MPSTEGALQMHDLVFSAKVSKCHGNNNTNYIEFSVDKVWKGDVKKKFISDSKCPHPFFEVGKSYLVYAHYKANNSKIIATYGVSSCSRTKKIQNVWREKLDGASQYFYMGQYIPAFQALFKTNNEMAALGKPKHDFSINTKD